MYLITIILLILHTCNSQDKLVESVMIEATSNGPCTGLLYSQSNNLLGCYNSQQLQLWRKSAGDYYK